MSARSVFYLLVISWLWSSASPLQAAPRDGAWAKVADAVHNKQPKTALGLLKPLETAAFADQAWGEGTKALLMRVRLQNSVWFSADPFPERKKSGNSKQTFKPDEDPFSKRAVDPFAEEEDNEDSPMGGLPGCVRQLETEIAGAPVPVRPILRWFQARWLLAHYERWSSNIRDRSKIDKPSDDDILTWDNSRFVTEIDKHFQEALAEKDALQRLPVSAFQELLETSSLGDTLRPTCYDLIAHSALEFLGGDAPQEVWPDDSFQITADSPVFDGTDAFLGWHPEANEGNSPRFRMLRIYQDLLGFHRDDPDRTAFLHCDLERIRWAGRVAGGGKKPARHAAAIRSFIAANAAHPLSADARQDDVVLWLQRNNDKEAHDSAVIGAEAFPKHPFGRMCRDLVRHFEEQSLEIKTPSSWPPSGDCVLIHQKNIEHLWFRLYRRDWPTGKALWNETPGPNNRKELMELVEREPDREWDAVIPGAKDFRYHQTSVDSPKDLKPGRYLLAISNNKDFSDKEHVPTWTMVDVTGLSIVADTRPNPQGLICGLVVDAISGAPRGGVKVECLQQPIASEDLVKQETKTADDGSFVLNERLDLRSKDMLLIASENEHRTVLRGPHERSPGTPSVAQSVNFFTDRAIYRPGQPIHFKGVWCEADQENGRYQTVNGKPVTVTLSGPNDQESAKLEVISNDYGSFSGTFIAPAKSQLGEFSIKAGKLGDQRLRVEEYKRPKFTVELQPPAKPAILGEVVEIRGIARAYTGAPIDGAAVEWEVERYPYWTGWWAWRYRDSSPFEGKKIASGTTVTAADGSFMISFKAEPDEWLDPAMGPAFDYDIGASVTDPTGEGNGTGIQVSASNHVSLGADLLFAEWQVTGKPVEFEIHTETLDGQPHPAEGTLRIHKLKEPVLCPREEDDLFFERDSLAFDPPSGPEGWELAEVIAEVAVKTELVRDGQDCIAKVAVTLPAGRYRAIFEAFDARRNKMEFIEDLQVVDPNAERFPTKIPLHVISPNLTCEPGESYTLLWGSGLEFARACVEWFNGGVLLKREWSVPGRTQQIFTFTPDESMRGGFNVRVTQCGMNRIYRWSERGIVPWSNKNLSLRWERLTSKLEPGAKDTWSAVISGPDGAAAAAEMVATLYDASLDELTRHSFEDWRWGQFRSDDSGYGYGIDSVRYTGGEEFFEKDQEEPGYGGLGAWGLLAHPFRNPLAALDEGSGTDGIAIGYGGRYSATYRERYALRDWGYGAVLLEAEVLDWYEPPELPQQSTLADLARKSLGGSPRENAATEARKRELDRLVARKNLRETAFFYPHLTSGEDGVVRISFTMPEGLGKWRFLGFAHDAAMRFGNLEGETVTAKDLMVQPNPPRFLREGDVLDFTVRITNQSEQEQSGLARLALADAANDQDRTAALGVRQPEQAFRIPAKQSRTLSWRLTVPEGTGFLRYKALATCGTLSDGEEGWLPVLPRRVLVTDSMALSMRDAGEKKITFEKLRGSDKSDTLRNQFLDVQVVSQPAWYAVMALPYLMEFPHECAEQIFNRYYANALGRHLVRSDPKIQRVFELWRNTDALDSPLTKSQDLKGILLEETPWLRDAGKESESRRRVGLLFEDNNLSHELAGSLDKLRKMQGNNGMWPWFSGGPDSEFISLYITAGFGRMRALGVETDITPALQALSGLDRLLTDRHHAIRKEAKKDVAVLTQNHLDPWVVHHLYTRSFFLKDKQITKMDQAARDYFLGQAKQYWPQLRSRLATAQVALALFRSGDATTAKLITRSLRETAVNHAETGMSWQDGEGEGHWWQAPIEAQAMVIEAFQEIDGDHKSVEACRAWLIQQKRVRDWGDTKATADAIHALLSGQAGKQAMSPLLSSDALMQVSLGGVAVEPGAVEAGTGFYEHRFAAAEVKPQMADIALHKTDPGVAWASLHWQYLEDLSKLGDHGSGALKLEKSLFVRRASPKGTRLEAVNGPVRVGYELVTRLVLRNDRAMEFVHLKDMRGSGTEPVNVLSGHRWQDGLGYYETTRDTASHFFIDLLPAGVHVFETSVRVQHAGVYQSGIAEIRCMYAPEFQARSGSVRLEVMRAGASE